MNFILEHGELIEFMIPVVICVLMVAVLRIALILFNEELEAEDELR